MAKSEAPADPRPYVRVSTDLPTNPKLDAIDDPAAGWAYVVSLCYSAQSLTDGHFPVRAVLRMANVDKAIATALAEQGLWHLPDHDCDRCEQPKAGHAVVHDYLMHQRSNQEVRDLTAKRREAGRKGAAKRWGPAKDAEKEQPEKPAPVVPTPEEPPEMASAIASAKQELWQTDGNAMADEMRGDEKREELKPSPLPLASLDGIGGDEPVEGEIVDETPNLPATVVAIPNAGQLTRKWVDHCAEHGIKLPTSTIKRYGKHISDAMKQGFSVDLIKRALAQMLDDNETARPSLLDIYLVRTQSGPAKGPRRMTPGEASAARHAPAGSNIGALIHDALTRPA